MSMLATAEAVALMLAAARPVAEQQELATERADGRVLARDIVSSLDVPPRDTSSMDGYAVRSADLVTRERVTIAGHGAGIDAGDGGEQRAMAISQRIPAGQAPTPLAPGSVARIFTGAWVPPGADAVVMQEQTEMDGARVLLKHRPGPGEWITRQGADIRRGAVILPAGTRLNPQALGLAASVGCATVPVTRRLKVAVFFTGDELTMPGQPLAPGGIYNSNRYTLRVLLDRLGCEVSDFGIVPDSLDRTRSTLRQAALDHDVILTSGGVSVGEEDHVKPAVAAEGRLNLWQIAMKPGKPLAFGEVDRSTGGRAFFVGLPGNPVSSFVTFMWFVRPFLLRCMGVLEVAPRAIMVRADFTQAKGDRRNEFLRARLNPQGGVDLFPNQSSAVLTSAVWADGLIDNPPQHVITAGQMVRFIPFGELM